MKTYTPLSNPIENAVEEARPRDKMLELGNAALSDRDIIAILIDAGMAVETNALAIAGQMLDMVNGSLSELGRRSVKDFMKFKGISEAKAITLAAALELGRRRQFSDVIQRDDIQTAQHVYDMMLPTLIDLPHEEFWILLLNRANHVIGRQKVSSGGVSGVLVDAKLVFRPALDALASGVILVHNHPSGNLKPSQADINLTLKLRLAGQTLDINVLDHVIVTRSGYFSFADEKMF